MQLDKNRAEISLLPIPLLSAVHSFLLVCAGADMCPHSELIQPGKTAEKSIQKKKAKLTG